MDRGICKSFRCIYLFGEKCQMDGIFLSAKKTKKWCPHCKKNCVLAACSCCTHICTLIKEITSKEKIK